MNWYEKAMKRMLKGVFLFLFPLMILFFVLGKAISIVQGIIQPIKNRLPEERILGIGMFTLISVILILLICYVAGLLVEKRRVRSWITKIENNVLIYIPGYSMMKRQTGDAIGETDINWQVVLIADNDDWKMGISIDRQPDGNCAVFFPEPPDAKSGEMKLIHESKLKKLSIPVNKLISIVRQYGQGAASLLNEGK